ncbi:hypothetical protein C3K47_11005 [Solitalea longa]|uniref:Secreted protein n=1 Tax=Solitalea longa TaxID=2079460 RepID=A0A2S5A132_9SPHI|nr:DUF6520 family protein [Solitalea longa]POY36276.1 hypothetical protein C3K47_11005 [Solitalea longa]
MKNLKITLAGAAMVVGIGSAFATSGKALLDQCPNNVKPANCNGGAVECCYITTPQGTQTVFRVQP